MDMDIAISGETLTILVSGAIDSEGAPELTNKFMELSKDRKLKHAIFNLSDVTSITSAGIGKLLVFYKHFDGMGGSFKIKGVSPQLKKQFDDIHLSQIIPVEAD